MRFDESFKVNAVVAAFFFLVSALYTYVGSWVGGAIILVVSLILWWGVRPAVRSTLYVPLEDAARHLYQAVERRVPKDEIVAPGSTEQERLRHFKYVLLTLNGVTLHGVEPPGRSRPIPDVERRHLQPADGVPNGLAGKIIRGARYVDVRISRWGLWRARRTYLAAAQEHAKMQRRADARSDV
jgi:hypothetical protein